MRRLVGKFAMLSAFVYVLVLLGGVIAVAQGTEVPRVTYALVLLPAAAFAVAVVDAIRLHRSSDPARTKVLWRRCAVFAGVGVVIVVHTAVMVDQVECC